jgi:hypothetical protein
MEARKATRSSSETAKRDRSVLSRVSDDFCEAIALTTEFGGVFGQFNLACPPQFEQRANKDQSFDLKEDALDLLIRNLSSLLRRGAAAGLRRSMLRVGRHHNTFSRVVGVLVRTLLGSKAVRASHDKWAGHSIAGRAIVGGSRPERSQPAAPAASGTPTTARAR